MQGKQGSQGVKGQPVSVTCLSFYWSGQSCSFLRDCKKSFAFFFSFSFFLQGDPGDMGLSGPLGNFGPKVRRLPILSDDM